MTDGERLNLGPGFLSDGAIPDAMREDGSGLSPPTDKKLEEMQAGDDHPIRETRKESEGTSRTPTGSEDQDIHLQIPPNPDVAILEGTETGPELPEED